MNCEICGDEFEPREPDQHLCDVCEELAAALEDGNPCEACDMLALRAQGDFQLCSCCDHRNSEKNEGLIDESLRDLL